MSLTPAHFLIGDYLKNTFEYDSQNISAYRLSTWQRIQQIKPHFWKRWHKEYLNELRTRNKWHVGKGSEMKVVTMVTIKEENMPPKRWSLGRIEVVHPGEMVFWE